MNKDEALKMALKNLLVATKHLDVCPSTVQAAEEAIAQPEQALEEDFCFCNDGINLQIVSGGAAVGGLYYCVTLKIDGEYVDYVRAQPEQEPVATVQCIRGVTIGYLDVMQPVGTKLYTSPPAREWVGLTDDELFGIVRSEGKVTKGDAWEIVENLQAKLKELNHD